MPSALTVRACRCLATSIPSLRYHACRMLSSSSSSCSNMTDNGYGLRPPLTVAVCGSTGTGKSQLAVELAQHGSLAPAGFSAAEIISADSMQMYRGLDVITNKATQEEMSGVPHHLMSVLDAERGEECDVGTFVLQAQEIIDRLHANARLPIVVGGTSYYLQHLLLSGNLISGSRTTRGEDESVDVVTDAAVHAVVRACDASLDDEQWALLRRVARNEPCEWPALEMWNVLHKLDPTMAARWHFRDTRKVHRSLRVLLTTGTRQSSWIAEQRKEKAEREAESPAVDSPPSTLVLWVYSDLSPLRLRLDARVDGMLNRGLLDEIAALRTIAKRRESATGKPIDFTRGIFQTIGYKEFDAFLTYCEQQGVPTTTIETDDAQRQRLLSEALAAMKLGTRQYAKRQIAWLRNKLAPALEHDSGGRAHLIVLDASDTTPQAWRSNVLDPALQALEEFMAGRRPSSSLGISVPCHLTPSASETPVLERDHALGFDVCAICTEGGEGGNDDDQRTATPYMVMRAQWNVHLRSRTHRAAMRRRGLLPVPGPDNSAAARAKRAARQQQRTSE